MPGTTVPTGHEYVAGEVILPFAYSARTSSAPRPPSLDFPHEANPDNCQVFVRIEDELWQFRCPWIGGKAVLLRYCGPDIDHMRQVEEGAYPEGLTPCWFLGGMWYEPSDRKLYAPMHIEQGGIHRDHPVARWSSRKIILATSSDKGRTWQDEGDIITPETYFFNHDAYKFSGSCIGNGVGDFGFYADTRGGYFYIFPEEGWYPKGKWGAAWSVRAVRCAMADKMAPGKWRYFYDGEWNEPALGGRSTVVAPSHLWGVIYSTYLEKYICMFPSNCDPVSPRNVDGICIGLCSDLAKQDWTWGYCPEAMFGFMTMTDAEGSDTIRCGQSFRHYAYGHGNTFQRTDVTLEHGATRAIHIPPRYTLEAHPESSDPIQGRRTKITGAASADTVYSGAWVDRRDPDAYEGRTRDCATAGGSVAFSFQAAGVYWRAVRSPESGRADVYLDGVLRRTVDCYSPRGTSCEQIAYMLTGLDPDVGHTIKVLVRGDKHPGSGETTIGHIAFEHAAESYKASAGFCSVMGKNNWHYQQWDGASFSSLRFAPNDLVMTNYWSGDGNCVVGPDFQIPDAAASVRTWVAPHGGRVRIEGRPACRHAAGSGVVASILWNGAALWPAQHIAWGQAASHDLTVTVALGDEISFMVAKGGPQADLDKAAWDPVITYLESGSAVWTPNPPGSRNLALGAYARSKRLHCTYRPFDAVDGSSGAAFVIHEDDKISVGDDWLMLDLEKPHLIDRYAVISAPPDAVPQHGAYRLVDFTLQASDDGLTWTDVDTVVNNAAERVARDVPAFRARYVRLYLPKGKPFAINEFELYRFNAD